MKTSLVPPTGMTASGAFFGIGSLLADATDPGKGGRVAMVGLTVANEPAPHAFGHHCPGMRAHANPMRPPTGLADVATRRKTHHDDATPASVPGEALGRLISSSRKLMKGQTPLQRVIGRRSSLGVSTLFVRSSPELVFESRTRRHASKRCEGHVDRAPGRGSRSRVARNPSSRARHGGPGQEFHAASMKRQARSSRAEAPLRSAGNAAP